LLSSDSSSGWRVDAFVWSFLLERERESFLALNLPESLSFGRLSSLLVRPKIGQIYMQPKGASKNRHPNAQRAPLGVGLIELAAAQLGRHFRAGRLHWGRADDSEHDPAAGSTRLVRPTRWPKSLDWGRRRGAFLPAVAVWGRPRRQIIVIIKFSSAHAPGRPGRRQSAAGQLHSAVCSLPQTVCIARGQVCFGNERPSAVQRSKGH